MNLKPIFAIVALLLAFTSTHANELLVRAPVVEVEPLTEPALEVEHCEPQPTSTGLAATLAWDLGENCRSEIIGAAAVTGYRVFYRWDDRVHSQIMTSHPGDSISLQVRLD